MTHRASRNWPVLALCLAAAWGWGGFAGAQNSLGLAVKSAYLYKFAPFIGWPSNLFANATSDFHLCVVGKDPFGQLLDTAVAGQKVAEHPIVVRRLAVAPPAADCHIMYIGGSHAQSVAGALSMTRGRPILTVTDGSSAPGLVDFVLDQGRVRFRIDATGAALAGLSIDSRLLSLAVSVHGANAGPAS